jgi:hypothetical protein
VIVLALTGAACGYKLTPEQQQQLVGLRQDLGRIRQEIAQANQEIVTFGGLIQSLVQLRLEVLKTNEALVEQRIQALESGVRITTVVTASVADPARAADLAKEIEGQRLSIAKARAQAEASGGLIQAMQETAVATSESTLALLNQQYLVAKYGIAVPALAPRDRDSAAREVKGSASDPPATAASNPHDPATCLKVKAYDASVLSTNDVYTELAWKADVTNSCTDMFSVRVVFTIYDKDEFELDSDNAMIFVPSTGTGKARGKMLVSPPEKARRMAKEGVRLSVR